MELGLVDEKKTGQTDVLVLPMGESYTFYSIDILNMLKEAGMRADIYLERGKFKKKMNYADKIGAKYALIVGEEEFNKLDVTVKNMETGYQVTVSVDEFLKYLD